jgi:S-sulfo-L-cysteine synthase (O-acetyl-L-serine-dependent)
MNLVLAKTDTGRAVGNVLTAARGRLPGAGPVADARAKAFDAYERTGLPHRRIEEWKYTDLRALSMLGTSGTFVGTTRRLKELNPRIQCISLQPDSSFHGIDGAKHMPTAIVPKIYDPTLADQNLEISTEDAYAMARRMSRGAGLLVGVSAAAAVVGCLQIAREVKMKQGDEAVIVTILCDSGEKYLSERFWTEK